MDLDKIATVLANPLIKGYGDLKQDILALLISDLKSNGYFVEFGVMDGIAASNTYMLEQHHGWRGIVAEAARIWQDQLIPNRHCGIDFRAVAGVSGQMLYFKEVQDQMGLSGLVDFFHDDEYHAQARNSSSGDIYPVFTVSLVDLLDQHRAPAHIDYISMDTEGSEAAILKTFDFDKYKVGLWTIEHNYHESVREEIFQIMNQNHYVRILPELSQIDDWYVPADQHQ